MTFLTRASCEGKVVDTAFGTSTLSTAQFAHCWPTLRPAARLQVRRLTTKLRFDDTGLTRLPRADVRSTEKALL